MPTAPSVMGTPPDSEDRMRRRDRGLALVREWFRTRGWTPWAFQEEAWRSYARGESGLIQVPTGAGKTYAAYGGPLAELIDESLRRPVRGAPQVPERALRVLYVSPLRAVARDVALALCAPLAEMSSAYPALARVQIESRSGDTSASVRARQRDALPSVLVTTPESLSLLLTRENASTLFASLRGVIVDEWHELISTKRGTQVELALARLRRFAPTCRTWALSATLPNAPEAAQAITGTSGAPRVIKATIARPIHIRTILPERVQAFPWAGHLGLRMFPAVLASLDPARSTLLFTNTRSQAELWHRAIRFAKPEWEARLAIHHGSIDRDERERVEGGIKSGEITLVVATSSLDLGVDFAPVERVYQIGSPKGVGRMIQRAGRASHRPGASCEIICVPTHAMELIEIDAVRRAIAQGVVEPRSPLPKPLDVLAQHLVTCALGGGIVPADFFDEVRSAHSYRTLTREEFNGTLALVTHGGDTLRVYPQFRKVVPDGSEAERHSVPDKRIATQHRLNVGTIVGEAVIDIQYASGRRLGTIEESFITMLRPGQKFLFAGKVVSYVGLHDMTAIVRPVPASAGSTGFTPHWAGTKLPITQSLGAGVRSSLHLAATPGAARESVELACAAPILASQARLSHVPAPDETLVEITRTREGTHLFVFPFEGRLVHAGLGAILALRLTRLLPIPTTFSIAVNDYGLELLSGDELALEAVVTPSLFETRTLAEDIVQSVDLAQVAKLPFREIVRVAGLVQQNYPGVRRSGRQQQASASLIYDVFREFDPGNLLLEQARREVFDRHFEQGRLARAMARVSTSRIVVATPTRPTPLAFPLIVERVSAKLSGETLADRLEKMVAQWDRPRDTPGASRRKEKHR